MLKAHSRKGKNNARPSYSNDKIGNNVSIKMYSCKNVLAKNFMKHELNTRPKFRLFSRTIPPKSQLVLDLHVKECSGVNFLEHVQVS